MSNPYASRPATAFWRKAVSGVPPFALDPMTGSPFTIAPSDRVATAGSCFAQNIARALRDRGLQYYVPETAPDGMDQAEARARNYGTFSARYGNVYTVRQLVQLFDRAHGDFDPALRGWTRTDSRWVDPFRPLIQPEGFADLAALEADRAAHLSTVRRMFADLSVFVFTLGLTEGWEHRTDGAVVPLAPGVAGGAETAADFRFVNYGAGAVLADLALFRERLARVNPAARIILTVSPVPLIATFEDRHVLVSTTYSKSVLHAAAVEASALPGVSYFPSYEIVTSPLNRDRYFEEDLRSVSPRGVEHVMRVFFRHYVEGGAPAGPAGGASSPDFGAAFRADFRQETAAARQVVCDEEAIEP